MLHSQKFKLELNIIQILPISELTFNAFYIHLLSLSLFSFLFFFFFKEKKILLLMFGKFFLFVSCPSSKQTNKKITCDRVSLGYYSQPNSFQKPVTPFNSQLVRRLNVLDFRIYRKNTIFQESVFDQYAPYIIWNKKKKE